MKNAIISQVSSHLYSPGCNEAILISDIPLQISSNQLNSSLCMDVDFSFHSQFPSNYYEYSENSRSSLLQPVHDDIFQSPYPYGSNYVHQSESSVSMMIQNEGKRRSACDDVTIQNTIFSHSSKKRSQRDADKLPTAVRRSQKLTDKITALQKLVSPYGKTDTASVLLETCISIKALQDQIENLFHIPMPSAHSRFYMREGEKLELQSRGLCLVPVKYIHQNP